MVVREPLEVVVERVRVERLERRGDAGVELPLPGRRERRERRVVQEPVRERALEDRVAANLAHDLGAEERGQTLGRRRSPTTSSSAATGNVRPMAAATGASCARLRGQAVDPGDEEVLERRREEVGADA